MTNLRINFQHEEPGQIGFVPVGAVPFMLVSIDEVEPDMVVTVAVGGGCPDDIDDIADFLGMLAEGIAGGTRVDETDEPEDEAAE